MAVTYVTSAQSPTNSGTVTFPSGTSAGQIAICHGAADADNATNGGAGGIVTPSGWSLGSENFSAGTWRPHQAWWWKELDGSESGSLTFGITAIYGALITVWDGAATPTQLANHQGYSSATTVSVPAATTTEANTVVLSSLTDQGNTTEGSPSGWTLRDVHPGYASGSGSTSVASKLMASAGSTGDVVWQNPGQNLNWSAQHIALTEAAAPVASTTFAAVSIPAGYTPSLVSSTLPGVTSITREGVITSDTPVSSSVGTTYQAVYRITKDSDTNDFDDGTITFEVV